MPLSPRLPWQHPWLTAQLVLRRILTKPWSDEAWREIRKEILTVLPERELPIVIASGRLNKPVKVPWWNGVPLHLTT